jgi:CheY-like chemotaxis protein
VLVSDIGMPGKGGYVLIGEVRQSGHRTQRIPAIALTACAHRDDGIGQLDIAWQRETTECGGFCAAWVERGLMSNVL